MTTVLLVTFPSLKSCQEIIRLLEKDENEYVDHSRTYTYTEELPNIHSKLENSHLKLILDPKDGSLKTLINKKEDVKVELRQRFMAYDGKLQSSSGLYVFNPHHEA